MLRQHWAATQINSLNPNPMKTPNLFLTSLAVAALWFASSSSSPGAEPAGAGGLAELKLAVAVLHSTAGNKCQGTVRFTQDGNAVKVVADLEGLNPGQKHAFHIHQYGDCSAPDAMSAGSHYNPEGHQHGLPEAEKRHAGDLGNVEADKFGKAHYEIKVSNVSIAGAMNPILGR